MIELKKTDVNAVIPTRGTEYAAGYDLYSIESYELQSLERKLFKTGINIAIPDGLFGRISPRSGLSFKNGIDVLGGTIDCFSGDCTIKTETGEKLIEELRINDVVYSINENFELERDFVSTIVSLGDKELLEIETEDGYIEITPGTRVYTETGIKRADELKLGEKILHF